MVSNRYESLKKLPTDPNTFWRAIKSCMVPARRLAEFGELSGSWPKSRVVCGVADEVHLRRDESSVEALGQGVKK